MRRRAAWLALVATLALLASACEIAEEGTETSTETEAAVEIPGEDGIYNPYGVPVDPLYEVQSAEISDGEFRVDDAVIIPDDAFSRSEERPGKELEEPEPGEGPKFSPVLERWLEERDHAERVEIIVTFAEDLRIPLLPELEEGADRAARDTARAGAIAELEAQRADSQAASLERLAEFGSFEPVEGFWIVNSVAGFAELGEVLRLAESPEVVYLQPVAGGEPPPQDANANNDAADARAWMVTDPYRNLGLTAPWIGLLDTGVRDSHQMFNSPDDLDWLRDCVNGGTDCDDTSNANYDTTDFSWNHGTRSAGVILGNDRRGAAYQGVTGINTDSWQIYDAGGLITSAAVRAIQAGLKAYDKVFVGEMQAGESEKGTIATAADNAYDAGVIFVSANGNFGPNPKSVLSPGIAHKVLGVGGYMTDGGAQYGNQGRGPATDGRYKPDIQAPTWAETSSNASDTAILEHTGTSAATAFASAATMLARNWLRKAGTFDNGQTYAFMILTGQNEWPYDNTEGAGPIVMPTNGRAWWGKVAVTDGLTIDIPINVGPGGQDFDVALWWPESQSQQHNDIDVHLIDPGGTERAKGYSAVSVFERTGVGGALAAGTWKVRIHGFKVKTSAQTVYWMATVRT